MRSSTAVPWPTSAATNSNWPSGGRDTAGHSSGSIKGTAKARNRHGNGSSASSAANTPQATAQGGAAAAVHTAPGHAASHCKGMHSPCTSHAATVQNGASQTPSKASGVINKVTSGMATRLARNPTTDTCWKNSIDNGARPTVAMSCVRKPLRTVAHKRNAHGGSPPAAAGRMGPQATGSDAISKPTAMNDSQNPGCSSAHGSSAVTTTAAASSTAGTGQRRPRLRRPTTTASIHTVRCAGTPQPASSA